MVSVARRVTRRASDPPLVPSWSTGILAGRAEVPIAFGHSEEGPTWWSVILHPAVQGFAGAETTAPNPTQTASSWARIRWGDGVTPPAYVTWALGGARIVVYGQTIEVTALPLVSAVVPAADGPSWGIIIEDRPLDRGRQDWIGLQATEDGGAIIPVLGFIGFIAPPYATAVQVRTTVAVPVVVDMAGAGVLALGQVPLPAGGGRVELSPRTMLITVTAPIGASVHVTWEVAP